MTFSELVRRERAAADAAVSEAERALYVAQRARTLVEGAISTGEMCVATPGAGRITRRADASGYWFSQAYSLASRLTR